MTRREAEVVRARLVNALHDQTYVVPSRAMLQDWVRDSWLASIETRVKPTTFRGYTQTMEQHVLPLIGARPLQKITATELNGLYAELIRGGRSRRPLSLRTVHNIHRTVHKSLADVVDAGVAVSNVAAKAKAPRSSRVLPSKPTTWRPVELAAFLDRVRGDRLEAIWRLAAMTGLRRGEVLGLQWKNVDLDRARLFVRRALVDVNHKHVESTTKGNRSRSVDLAAETVPQLHKHRESQQRERVLWADLYKDGDLVAAWEDGSQVHPHALSRMFAALVRVATLPRIRFHDLRHTHATLALEAGVPITVVSERLGHCSLAFTLSQYVHAMPGMQAAAAAAVAELVAGQSSRTEASAKTALVGL